jgi:outer membrane immunogenic protein
MFRSVSMVAVCLLVMAAFAVGQESKADVAISGIASFSKDTSGNNINQSVTNSGGFLGSFRYGLRGHSGVEFNYGYTRNSQLYTNTSSLAFNEQQAGVHELTGAYLYQLNRERKVSPFVLGGGGFLIFRPISISSLSLSGASTDVKGTFLYGAGANYRLTNSLGLRVQFRGLIYKSPDFGVSAVSTGSWAHTAEPSVGITWHF